MNIDLDNLIQLIVPLVTSSTICSESWGFLNLKDSGNLDTLKNIKEIQDYFVSTAQNNILIIKVDNQSLEEDDLELYIQNNTTYNTWEINVNKQSFLSNNSFEYTNNFFLSINEFERWMSGLSAFDTSNPFHSKVKVIVNGLDALIIGKRFQIVPLNSNEVILDFTLGDAIPESDNINKVVHYFTNEDIIINPLSFVYQTNSEQNVINIFTKLACLSLSASIVNEFYSNNKITLDGIKKINLKLYENEEQFPAFLYNNLLKLVKWIYEEKTITRQKLFNDRITLDLDENGSYILALRLHLESSFNQAIQRYNFVILERKDKYILELKDLLKDIRNQSELYSQKIRTLLNNLLRDALAALLLVGFTLFNRFSDNLQLDKDMLLHYIFYTLSIYYLISITLQTIVDITDIQVSKREMYYWKQATKELLPEKDFKEHISKSLEGRKYSLRIIYPIIVILYLFVAYSCYKFPDYFHKISQTTKYKVVSKVQDKIKYDKVYQRTSPTNSSSSSRK